MKPERKTRRIYKTSKSNTSFSKRMTSRAKRECVLRRLRFLLDGEITNPQPPKPSPIPPDGKKKPGRKKKKVQDEK